MIVHVDKNSHENKLSKHYDNCNMKFVLQANQMNLHKSSLDSRFTSPTQLKSQKEFSVLKTLYQTKTLFLMFLI